MPEELRNFPNRDLLVHIVDPDTRICESLSVLFRLEGYQTTFSVDVASFAAALDGRRPDVVIANLKLGTQEGGSVLRRVKALRNGTPVFVVLDAPDVGAAVGAMRRGRSISSPSRSTARRCCAACVPPCASRCTWHRRGAEGVRWRCAASTI